MPLVNLPRSFLHPKGHSNQSLFQVVLFGKFTTYACGNGLEINALFPILCKLLGKFKLLKSLLANANDPMLCKFWLKVMLAIPWP